MARSSGGFGYHYLSDRYNLSSLLYPVHWMTGVARTSAQARAIRSVRLNDKRGNIMRALIAHRRLVTTTNGAQVYELAIGARNFACFNGFNVEGAFNKMNDPEMVSMVTSLDGSFRNNTSNWLCTNAQRTQWAQGKTLGAWECVGIGWLYNGATANAGGPTANRQLPPNSHAYDFTVGNALRREGFMGRYYDAWNGAYLQSIRQLTPMETYLSRVFSLFEIEDAHQVPSGVQSQSAFAAAVHHNRSLAGCLYQFVGSERPSGQAVAFLQTFRNVSEVQYTGWNGSNQMKYSLIVKAYSLISRDSGSTESIYPLMDHLVNYGTDNAITCYAGGGVMLHGMKYGFWSLKEFFARPESMLREGRYNKGAQSTNLGAIYSREAVHRGVVVDQGAVPLFTSLKNALTQHPVDIAQLVTYDQIIGNAGNIARFIENITNKIRQVAASDQSGTVTRLIEVMRGHGDARRPPEPVAPPVAPARATQGAAQSATPRNTTAGAAMGFTQWTSQAVY